MKKRNLSVFLLVGAMTFSLIGCSEVKKESSVQSEEVTYQMSGEEVSSAAEKGLADYLGNPAFKAENFDTIDAKAILDGKRIFLICVNSTNDYMLGMTQRYEDLVKACGGDVFVYYADGTTDTIITGMQTAISPSYLVKWKTSETSLLSASLIQRATSLCLCPAATRYWMPLQRLRLCVSCCASLVKILWIILKVFDAAS